jgi:hypothetical protein
MALGAMSVFTIPIAAFGGNGDTGETPMIL